MLNNILKVFKNLIFPSGPYCCFCSSQLNLWDRHWCSKCWDRLQEETAHYFKCSCCSKYIEYKGICSHCKENTYPFSTAYSAGAYEGVLKKALHNFKYENNTFLAEPLGKLLSLEIIKNNIYKQVDLIIEVPLHKNKLATRGYNQSQLLAEIVARETAITYRPNCLEKIIATPDMVTLDKKRRFQNLSGAFQVVEPQLVQGKRILLIDDIFTTGYTAASCSEILLNARALEVIVITVASNFDKFTQKVTL